MAVRETEHPVQSPEIELGTGNKLWFDAVHLQQQRTGTHAKVRCILDSTVLAGDFLNVDKLDQRRKLIREAYDALEETLRGFLPIRDLYHIFDQWCDGIWVQHIGAQDGDMVVGDPTLEISHALLPWMQIGGGTFLFAPPGTGKTQTALLMAVSIDAGVGTIWPVQAQRVLYINLERSELAMRRRLGCINTVLGLDPGRPLLCLNRRGSSLSQVTDLALNVVRRHKVGVVFLDSISRAGLGKLTEDQPANEAGDTLNALTDTWLAVAHPPRATSDHILGSVMFDAAADVIVKLSVERQGNSRLGISLAPTKVNEGRWPEPQVLAYEFDTFGLCGVQLSSYKDFPKLAADKDIGLAEAVEEYLREVSGADATEIATATGFNRSNISDFLNSDKKYTRIRREGRKVIWGVKFKAPQGNTSATGQATHQV